LYIITYQENAKAKTTPKTALEPSTPLVGFSVDDFAAGVLTLPKNHNKNNCISMCFKAW
jgi:hypothetical protein